MAKHSSQSTRANRASTENPLKHAKGSVPADFAARLAAGRRRTKLPASSPTGPARGAVTGGSRLGGGERRGPEGCREEPRRQAGPGGGRLRLGLDRVPPGGRLSFHLHGGASKGVMGDT